jgi:hypothetical protein
VGLRIRELEVRVSTAGGMYGTRISFPDGLVVLRAENTSGKSLCMQAIIYALGLEGMFGPSRDVPLQHAVTDYLEADESRVEVGSSEVLLEISNGSQDVMTVRRTIKGERSRDLITVWRGKMLTQPEVVAAAEEYYVRIGGGATAPSGFHRLLAEFLEWHLPQVPTFAGIDSLLYLEIIFPLLYVEQKTGWGAIEGRFPTHFRVREAGVRAVEFLLGLDARAIAERRANLKLLLEAVRRRWADAYHGADTAAREVGAVVQGIPSAPQGDWPPPIPPTLRVPVAQEWVPVDEVLTGLRARAAELAESSVVTTEEAAPEMQEQLRVAEGELRDHERRITGLLDTLQADQGELERLHARLHAVDEDLVRNKDARKLQGLGAVSALKVSAERCPTCHQQISEVLLPLIDASDANPMSVDQNIEYLDEQRKVFTFMLAQASASIDARERQLAAERAQAAERRAAVRAFKRALVSDARLPSLAAVEEQVRVANRIERLEAARRKMFEHTNAMTELASEWARLREELDGLRSEDLSASDQRKLSLLQQSFSEQLRAYGVTSVGADQIIISKDTFRPTYGDFDLQFDFSASDTIRSAWAYRIALLEVARNNPTNHPGLLMLDEPRQQEVSATSLAALLERLSRAGEYAQQVVVATSEPQETLEIMLGAMPATVISFPGRILGRLA